MAHRQGEVQTEWGLSFNWMRHKAQRRDAEAPRTALGFTAKKTATAFVSKRLPKPGICDCLKSRLPFSASRRLSVLPFAVAGLFTAAASGAKFRAMPKTKPARAKKPKLLSGGNPQIAKSEGQAPIDAYIAAMPGWKSEVGRRLDALISRTVPNVHKAVKWNSPLYGIKGEGWFLGIHCFAKYIKVAFFKGALLSPVPPGKSKQKEVRYLDIYEDDKLDEAQFAGWVKQASQLPGERM